VKRVIGYTIVILTSPAILAGFVFAAIAASFDLGISAFSATDEWLGD